jgi:hypothetical protein
MTECYVYCYDCPPEHGRAKQWAWLCEICAEEQVEVHRKSFGHDDMRIDVPKVSMRDVQTLIDRIARTGW